MIHTPAFGDIRLRELIIHIQYRDTSVYDPLCGRYDRDIHQCDIRYGFSIQTDFQVLAQFVLHLIGKLFRLADYILKQNLITVQGQQQSVTRHHITLRRRCIQIVLYFMSQFLIHILKY